MFGFFFIIYSILYLLIVNNEVQPVLRLTAFRAVILPLLLYFVGRYTLLNKNEISLLLRLIILIGVISVILGVIELLLPTKYTWNGIFNLSGYLTNIKGFTREMPQNVPVNFFGYLGRRLAGLSASPLAQGYFLEFIFFLLLASWIHGFNFSKKFFLLLMILVGELLTITRASILTMFFVLPVFFLVHPKVSYLRKISYIYVVILIVLLPFLNSVLDLGEKTLFLGEGSAKRHIYALDYSIKNLEEVIFVGKGFGTAGGWVTSLGGEVLGAWENAYAVIAFQIGIPGLILFLVWWGLLAATIFNAWIKKSSPLYRTLFAAVSLGCIAYFLTGFVSEQILTFSSVAHFWIFAGIAVSLRTEENSDQNRHEYK